MSTNSIDALRGISSPAMASSENEVEVKKRAIIEKGLEKYSANLTREEKEIATNKLMAQSTNGSVKIGGEEIYVSDLAFEVALSIQSMESETTPLEEYWRFIKEGQDVLTEMTTDGVKPDELVHRNNFIGHLDQRETEMRVCMALYASSNNPAAKEKYNEMLVKLAKLMEIRSAIKNGTKNSADEPTKEEKELAKKYVEFLAFRKVQYEDKTLYTDMEYSMFIAMAQAAVALSNVHGVSKENDEAKARYIHNMELRLQEMMFLRESAMRNRNESTESMQNTIEMQKRIAAHQELMNLVKVATTPSRESIMLGRESEEDRVKREVCNAVLEYRLRGKEVPDKILYKLGVKSFVPDYSLSEDLLNKKMESHSKEDSIKRINELSGRQSILVKPRLEQMQKFDSQRFIALQKLRGESMSYSG